MNENPRVVVVVDGGWGGGGGGGERKVTFADGNCVDWSVAVNI